MLTENQILFRLVLATVLSGLIGIEREMHGRTAGFRTHILVCIGSTLIMLTSMHIFDIYKGLVSVDPARIAAGVITGIGFLGAGTILRFRASVRGLTTAASLWVVAGIGLAVGSGLYSGAYITTLITLVSLFLLTKIERDWVRRDWYRVISIKTRADIEQLTNIRKIFSNYGVEIKDLELKKTEIGDFKVFEFSLRLLTNKYDDEIISKISQLDGVEAAKWLVE